MCQKHLTFNMSASNSFCQMYNFFVTIRGCLLSEVKAYCVVSLKIGDPSKHTQHNGLIHGMHCPTNIIQFPRGH